MKEKAWKNVIAVLIIALALMAGGINVSAASGITIRQGKVYQNNKVYTGWFSQNNGKYYSVKGIRARITLSAQKRLDTFMWTKRV